MRLHDHRGLFLAASLITAAGTATDAAAGYITGFEQPEYVPGGLVTGQDGWNGPATARIATAGQLAAELSAAGLTAGQTVRSGNQALLATGGQTNIRPVPGLADKDVVALDYWTRPLTPGSQGSTIGAGLGNSFVTMEDHEGRRAVAVRLGYDAMSASGSFDVYTAAHPDGGGGWLSTGAQWQAGAWFHIRTVADYVSQTFDLFINGEKINSVPVTFYAMNSDNFSQFRVFTGGGQAGMILDDIRVSSVPEPASWGLMLAGGCALLLRRGERDGRA